jgi:pseudouridine-5'-phosphate glycosidase
MQHEQLISLAPNVAEALPARRPVVALESTVIAHGLPYPQNKEVAHALEAAVRDGGATPATIGVLGGVPTVGLDETEIERFATSRDVLKLSRRGLALAVAQGRDGATTVAATMALAHLAGIEIFATGGIGGVHRGARDTWDVSADLTELARTPVLVVCAGAKAILDLPATLEVLETYGVPVVGYRTDEFPAFYCRTSGLRLPARADTPDHVAALWRAHQRYGGGSGMLLAVPPPEADALPVDEVEAAITRALAEAERNHIRGAEVTPFLLAAMERETGGQSLRTNVALLKNNARVAAEVAVQLSMSNER